MLSNTAYAMKYSHLSRNATPHHLIGKRAASTVQQSSRMTVLQIYSVYARCVIMMMIKRNVCHTFQEQTLPHIILTSNSLLLLKCALHGWLQNVTLRWFPSGERHFKITLTINSSVFHTNSLTRCTFCLMLISKCSYADLQVAKR